MALIGPHPPMALTAPTPPALPAPDAAAPPTAAPAGGSGEPKWQPPAWAPPLGAVQYVRDAVTALLLVLALPYVLYKLVTRPAWLLDRAGRKHVEP